MKLSTSIDVFAHALEQAEQPYVANQYSGLAAAGSVEFHQGANSLLLIAAHATNHNRNDAVKYADRFTGAFAKLLAAELDISYLIASGVQTDWLPWAERFDPMKEALEALSPRICIDLHGMSNAHGFDIALGLGTIPTPQVLELEDLLIEDLKPFVVRSDTRFSAKSPLTITSFLAEKGSTSLQMEVKADLRTPPTSSNSQSYDFYVKLRCALERIATMG